MVLVTDTSTQKAKILFYGRGGTGKTKAAGSACLCPDTSPYLHISIGGNPRSLALYNRPLHKMTVVEVTDMKDFNDLYTFLQGGQETKHPLWTGFSMTEPFKAVCLDGATLVNQKVINLITGNRMDGDFADVPRRLDPRDYGSNLDMMTEWASLFFGLAERDNARPIHVFMTALEREPTMDLRSKEDRAAGVKGPSIFSQTFRPQFVGQAISVVESLAEVIVRMVPVQRMDADDLKEVGTKRLDTKTHWNIGLFAQGPDYVAKDQTLKLGSHMYDPTISEMWRLIYGTAGTVTP